MRQRTSEPHTHQCQATAPVRSETCTGWFEHRTKGGNKYCDACKTSSHKRHQQARKAVSRALGGLSRRDFLLSTPGALLAFHDLLDEPRQGRGAEESFERLRALERLLDEQGPQQPDVRRRVVAEASAILATLLADRPAKPANAMALTLAHGVLRDAGALGSFEGTSRLDLLDHAVIPVEFYRRIRAHERFVDALLRLANTQRLLKTLGLREAGDAQARACVFAAVRELDVL